MRESFVVILAMLLASAGVWGQAATGSDQAGGDLAAAVADLRGIDPSKLTQAELQARAMALNKAWRTIAQAGPAGLAALKAELAAVDEAGERDDFFRLSLGPLMWQLAGPDAAQDIAAAWEGVPLHTQYNYVFSTAVQAAETRDARVLPILRLLLKDKQGRFPVRQHAMVLTWPDTVQFVWGIYGSGGLAELAKVLESSQDATALCSAMLVLGVAQYLPALPAIRRLTASEDEEVACRALCTLGEFGHPQDFDLLAAAARSPNAELAWGAAYGLIEYQDMRAVPLLCELAEASDQALRVEALAGLELLLNLQGFEAIRAHADQYQGTEEGEMSTTVVGQILRQLNLDAATFDALPTATRQERLAALMSTQEAGYRPAVDDTTLTREQFAEAAAEWKSGRRITGGRYRWVRLPHILQVATPEDLDLLFDIRAAVLTRLSDECLHEAETLDTVIRRIGRSRYRQEVGVTQRVLPVTPQPATQAAH